MLPNLYKWRIDDEGYQKNIVQKILEKRGIVTDEEVYNYLNPDRNNLHSPYLLNEMKKAVDRIDLSLKNMEEIVIYGDYDVDGITSTSILYMFLKSQGYKVSYYIPDRLSEGYGLNQGALKEIAQTSKLVITVDTGIAAVEEVKYAKELGLDIIITDHHECQELLPEAYCIINPKRNDSTYPFKYLAGVGVTFKLIHALAIEHQVEDQIWQYTDIVALGTVADIVSLTGENRILVHMGLNLLQDTKNMGLKELITLANANGKNTKITTQTIGYQIGPRINASGRLSDAKIGVELLITKDLEKAKELAKLLDSENKKRQEMEISIIEEAEKYIQQFINKEAQKVFVIAGQNWHHGVIGIVASRIMNKYYRPVIVLSEEEGILSGSARSIEGFSIFEALSECKDYLVKFGGHDMAAGLTLDREKLEMFTQKINAYANKVIDEEMLIPKLSIDSVLEVSDIHEDLYQKLERLEPFGVDNPKVTFCIKAEVRDFQTLGQEEKHIKLTLGQGDKTFQAIGFGKGYLADYIVVGEEVVVAGELLKNEYLNKVTLQLSIKDIQSSYQEVLRSKYYLSLYDYLEKPNLASNKIYFKEEKLEDTSNKVINVFTEQGLYEVARKLQNSTKNITSDLKVCYNSIGYKDNEVQILVNPLTAYENAINYDWDFNTNHKVYSCIYAELDAHKKQVDKMIPNLDECREAYKVLKRHPKDFITMHQGVHSLEHLKMTEYKLLKMLDIFSELKILKYSLSEDKIYFEFMPFKKTSIEHSSIYIELQQLRQSLYHIIGIH